jgi:serine protease Do
MFLFISLLYAQPKLPLPKETTSGQEQKRRTDLVRAVEQAAPAVVSITTAVPAQDPFSWFYGERTSSADGSGFVIEKSGIILTNAHVVEQAVHIEAHFSNGQHYQAELIGIASELDLAVLQLVTEKTETFPVVSIGRSSGLLLGESVIAIGNPLGLGLTVTTGVISATDRVLETDRRVYQDFLQTDASINPGNSGGPLLDINARLIGINTAIRADAQNIGFAIPVDRAIKVAQDLLTYGELQIPWLGIDVVDVVYRTSMGRQVAPQIQHVWNDKGLKRNDLLISIDGRQVRGRSDLNAYLAMFKPGKKVALGVIRNGEEKTIAVQTSELPEDLVSTVVSEILGITVVERQGGVVLESLSSSGAFAKNRLMVGDQLLAFNGAPISSRKQLLGMIAQAKSEHRSSAFFTIRRGNAQGRLELPL